MRRSDFLPFVPGRFVAFAPRYRRCALVRSCGHEHDAHRPGADHRLPHPDLSTEATGSPRFLGNPMRACPALRPRWDLCARPLPRVGAAFRLFNGVGSHKNRNFEARSHGPRARCLRFARRVTPSPRKTRFRLPARRCRAGVSTRWVPIEGFCFIRSLLPPSPSFAWRTEKLR